MKQTEDIVKKYVDDEFKPWKEELKQYWDVIDQNQELYEFYKRFTPETTSDISLNTPFSIVESMVAKANDTNLQITVKGKGDNDLDEFGEYVAAITKNTIEDPDISAIHGSFRKIKEKFFRNLLVQGNAIAKVDWCYKTQVVDNKKKVIADNPYCQVVNLKKVVFNPTRTLANSDIYYVESDVKYADLQKNEYDERTGRGLYKNLGQLRELANKKSKQLDDEYFVSGDKKIMKRAEPIRILERYEGTKYLVIADDKVIIREETDPFKVGGHNLLFAMDYVVGDRPYAYGEIDAIYKPVLAQDKIINQSIDMVNDYLRPKVLVNSQANMDLDELIMIIENGGVMQGDPAMVGNVPVNIPPREAFQTIDVMQQAIERAARFSPYAAGIPAQQTDKTQGTMGGIQSIQMAAEPNFQIKLDTLQESFMQPYARICLKMTGNLMGEDDVRYGLMQGKNKGWVKATKGILQGSATLQDLATCGFITQEQFQDLATEPVVEPLTGQTIMQPIPGIEEAIVFDVDWVLDVKLDSRSAADKQQEVARKMATIDMGTKLGAQFSPDRTVEYFGQETGFDEIKELLLTEEEKAKIAQQQMMAQQQQAEQQMQSEQMKIQGQEKMQGMKTQADLTREQMRGQNQMQVAQARSAY